jgi:hypothetical protein
MLRRRIFAESHDIASDSSGQSNDDYWTHSSIEQRHELPDNNAREDGHGNVSVAP